MIHRVLVGATASGKKSVAVRLAERHGCAVLAMDSMKVYRGMDIGTDKPDAEMRSRVPYQLLDLVGHHESFSAGHWIEAAKTAVDVAPGPVLFAGGTPLYLRLMVRGIFAGPGTDTDLRARFEALWEARGELEIRRQLREVDPVLEARLLPGDRKRLIRGLEVHALTGEALSKLQAEETRPPIPGRFVIAALRHPQQEQRQRLERRVGLMLERGLLEEVQALAQQAPFAVESGRAIGYAECLAFLAGDIDRKTMAETIVRRTSRLVRKQGTFLRSFQELTWVNVDPGESAEELTDRVERILEL